MDTKAEVSGAAEAWEATARAVNSKDCAALASNLLPRVVSKSFSAATPAAWASCKQRHCKIAASAAAAES